MDAAEAAPSFTAWARDSPSDEACVSMVVGSGAEQNGRWEDRDRERRLSCKICDTD